MKNVRGWQVVLLGLPMLLLPFAGDASAALLQFENSSNFNGVKLGKDSGTSYVSNTGTYTWTHALPTDFDPRDKVFSATLTIQVNKLDEGQNQARVNFLNVDLGSIKDWDSSSSSVASDRRYSTSIGGVLATWSAGAPLLFSLDWNTPNTFITKKNGTIQVTDNWIELQRSTFNLAYENISPPMGPAAPVPEPATLLLFGTGLAGFGGAIGRAKRKELGGGANNNLSVGR